VDAQEVAGTRRGSRTLVLGEQGLDGDHFTFLSQLAPREARGHQRDIVERAFGVAVLEFFAGMSEKRALGIELG
jgi:hypothetical protein